MKTLSSLVLVSGLVGCGGTGEVSPYQTPSIQAKASVPYDAANSVMTLPSAGFCHPIYFGGAGGHALAPTYPWGVPAYGGWATQANGAAYAYAYDTSIGQFATSYECHAWSDFHGALAPGLSGSYELGWDATPTLTNVLDSKAMSGWHSNSPCWIDGVGHLSAPGESVSLDITGSNWHVRATGFPALFVSARCAWLGRPIQPLSVVMTATPGHDAYSELTPTEGTCFLLSISGNLDSGSAFFRKAATWQLEVHGAVTEAIGYCLRY